MHSYLQLLLLVSIKYFNETAEVSKTNAKDYGCLNNFDDFYLISQLNSRHFSVL